MKQPKTNKTAPVKKSQVSKPGPVKKKRKPAPPKAVRDETYRRDFEYVCLEIEKGFALRNVVKTFMSMDKFNELCRDNKDLNDRYARATAQRHDSIFEEMLDIADNSNLDVVIGEEGRVIVNGEAVQRSRLRIETRKWMLGKLAPKKYGDKLEVDHKSSDGTMSPPTPIRFTKGSKDKKD
jgi:hypothetical protein